MMLLRSLVLLMLSGLPATADAICRPEPGQSLRVVGVAANDPLNVRAGAGGTFKVLGTIRAGQPDVRATGRVAFLRDSCKLACSQLLNGIAGGAIASVIEQDCRARGRIWYEVVTSRGLKGWASAGFLLPGAATKPTPPGTRPPIDPMPMPTIDPVHRFSCMNSDRIVVTLRAATQDAQVVNKAGRILYLGKRAGGPPINYTSPAFGGMSLQGSPRQVSWQEPGRQATTCVEMP
ncbi:MAG: hypothetical protein ACK414_14745 [Gemmobacter sp.]